MKKLCCLLVSVLLLTAAALPASAEAAPSADLQLQQVTQAVKAALDLDTDAYTSFHGDCSEGELVPLWDLWWEGDAGTLSVTALSDGTIVSYDHNPAEAVSSASGHGLPSFPKGDPDQARAAAEAFLAKVLDPGLESVSLTEPSGFDRLDSTTYRFSGTVLLHGLPSPLRCSVTVRASDNAVTRFWRDVPESMFLGDIPGSAASVTRNTAAGLLGTQQSLRLEYILPEGADTAVLCYLPNPVHTFYVDARTGQLVDLTALEEDLFKNGMGGAAAGDTAAEAPEAESGLSAAEEAGIRQLEGVLSSQELDKALRAVTEYGLSRYTLASARFTVGEAETGGEAPVTCTLRYSRSDGSDVYGRTFTVDARTGEVQRVSASFPYDPDHRSAISETEAQAKAEAFLQNHYGERYAHLALYETPGQETEPLAAGENVTSYSFRFARQENGYFFPDHCYTVRIDAGDGTVCGFSFQYDDAVAFDAPDGIRTAEAALDAWMDTYQVTLGYVLVPQPLTGSDTISQRLRQMGLSSFYYLKLGYTLEREASVRGIDAKSGQPVSYASSGSVSGLTYTDAAGSWAAAELQRLGRYNVGYDGGLFQPDKLLTQWDLVCLLYSLNRSPLDPAAADDGQRDAAYAAAYELGALTRAQRNDSAILTRGQVVRCLLDAAGYGPVARLEGIFTCAYPDRASIPAGELGYAALAQGLGLVRGAYDAASPATRAQAAVMLCRLMER